MKPLEKNLVRFISDRNLKILRDKRGTALNVSYTEDGLKWTTTIVGRLPYFKNAVLVSGRMVGDLTPSTEVTVEDFVPYDHPSPGAQIAEYAAIKKATHLLYGSPA